eukprot:417685_1
MSLSTISTVQACIHIIALILWLYVSIKSVIVFAKKEDNLTTTYRLVYAVIAVCSLISLINKSVHFFMWQIHNSSFLSTSLHVGIAFHNITLIAILFNLWLRMVHIIKDEITDTFKKGLIGIQVVNVSIAILGVVVLITSTDRYYSLVASGVNVFIYFSASALIIAAFILTLQQHNKNIANDKMQLVMRKIVTKIIVVYCFQLVSTMLFIANIALKQMVNDMPDLCPFAPNVITNYVCCYLQYKFAEKDYESFCCCFIRSYSDNQNEVKITESIDI